MTEPTIKKTAGIAAVVCAVLAAVSLVLYMQRFEEEVSGGDPIEVLVAVADLQPGTLVTREMLALRAVPERWVETRQVPAGELNRVIGVRVSTVVRAGESLLWTDLADYEQARDLSSLVRDGMRAVTIHADGASSFDGLLRPGDRVDVLLTSENGDARTTSSILQNVLVLAAGADTGGPASEEREAAGARTERRVREITLSVTLDQSQVLALAEAHGRLTLALRNPEDIAIVDGLPARSSGDLARRGGAPR